MCSWSCEPHVPCHCSLCSNFLLSTPPQEELEITVHGGTVKREEARSRWGMVQGQAPVTWAATWPLSPISSPGSGRGPDSQMLCNHDYTVKC